MPQAADIAFGDNRANGEDIAFGDFNAEDIDFGDINAGGTDDTFCSRNLRKAS